MRQQYDQPWHRRQLWHILAGLRIFVFMLMQTLRVFAYLLAPLALLAAICVGLFLLDPLLLLIPIGCVVLLGIAHCVGAIYHDDKRYDHDELRWG